MNDEISMPSIKIAYIPIICSLVIFALAAVIIIVDDITGYCDTFGKNVVNICFAKHTDTDIKKKNDIEKNCNKCLPYNNVANISGYFATCATIAIIIFGVLMHFKSYVGPLHLLGLFCLIIEIYLIKYANMYTALFYELADAIREEDNIMTTKIEEEIIGQEKVYYGLLCSSFFLYFVFIVVINVYINKIDDV